MAIIVKQFLPTLNFNEKQCQKFYILRLFFTKRKKENNSFLKLCFVVCAINIAKNKF